MVFILLYILVLQNKRIPRLRESLCPGQVDRIMQYWDHPALPRVEIFWLIFS